MRDRNFFSQLPSEYDLLVGAVFLLTFLSVLSIAWIKFTELVERMFHDFMRAVRSLRLLWQEFRTPLSESPPVTAPRSRRAVASEMSRGNETRAP